LKQLRLAELRKEIAIGVAQADGGEFVDGEKTFAEIAAVALRGSAPTDEAVRPNPTGKAGCQRNLGLHREDNIEAADRVLDALAKNPGIATGAMS